ncbi:MAG: HAD family hydrolase [Lachnospiraceae bacterium]|nr:HAD family hydrolase [Lachnospiraceae bacterium]
MIKAVVFDMFETLVTHYRSDWYFGEHIAADLGLSEDKFREVWDATEDDRTLGKRTFEETIKEILQKNNMYSDDLCERIVTKRFDNKKEIFKTFREDIIPMLEALHERSLKIALISNCFDEEVAAIKPSRLYPYFDVPILSYEVGLQKPDLAIYELALERLDLKPVECLYVGDGGNSELQSATKVGMKALQARWYLPENTRKTPRYMYEFDGLDEPMDILKFL